MAFDLIVSGGTVLDGSGAPGYPADVAVTDGVIAALGRFGGATAARRIDAAGQVVAPGFIDIHTHSDVTLTRPSAGVNKICQGVTTEVTGNCGFSAFPVAPGRAAEHAEHLAYLGPDQADLRWRDFDGYAEAVTAARPIANVGCLAGHGTLRIAAGVPAAASYPAAYRDALTRLLEECLEQGALGFTTGLTYVPSMFGTPEEIAALGAVAARYDALYATHARGVAGQEQAAVAEAIEVGRGSGVRVEFSHLAINDPRSWGQAGAMLALFDQACAEGLDIGFDVYPYDASASSIAQYFPAWLTVGGLDSARRLLADPVTRGRALRDLAAGWYGGIPWRWDRVLVTHSAAGDTGSPGHTIAELASGSGRSPASVLLGLYEEYGNAVQVAMFYRTEEDMRAFLEHPRSVVGSDGVAMAQAALADRPHPRFYGTFPRVLGRYARDTALITLAAAVRKMTGEPADRCRLAGRGYLRPGYAADLVVFGAAEVRDTATFAASNQLPAGIDRVLVNGTEVVTGGAWNGATAGRVLRRGIQG
jgi:N-acyl-D-aspartate/D-glutamate deacylase